MRNGCVSTTKCHVFHKMVRTLACGSVLVLAVMRLGSCSVTKINPSWRRRSTVCSTSTQALQKNVLGSHEEADAIMIAIPSHMTASISVPILALTGTEPSVALRTVFKATYMAVVVAPAARPKTDDPLSRSAQEDVSI